MLSAYLSPSIMKRLNMLRLSPLVIALIATTLSTSLSAGAANAGDTPSYMVASANPHATNAGLEIMKQGGSAVDAAIAVQAVLTLVEPQSSGIGGGAFMMLHNFETGSITAYDGREVAPAGATEALFLKEDGTAESKRDVIPGGRSVGVPGIMAMLALAHEENGKLPWRDLFQPAIKLASEGFAISPRFHFMVNMYKDRIRPEGFLDYFYDSNGDALPVGYTLKNQALADTLSRIADEGAGVMYEGALADAIVSAVNNSPINPGTLSTADMAGYEPKKRGAVCAPYRQYKICGMPPPSSGGIAVVQILNLLEEFELGKLDPGSTAAANLFLEAARLAYADRATHLGDTDFVHVPVEGLVDTDYLDSRSKLIIPGKVMEEAPAGTPPGTRVSHVTMDPGEIPATSHFSIVDAAGNVLAMTTTIESAYGSRLMVNGFLLNNQLTDFTFVPRSENGPVANRVEPGKRPLSSMSPTIVYDEAGRPIITVGSPGGPLIISFVAKTLLGLLDWDMTMQEAVARPNLFPYGKTAIIEKETSLSDHQQALEALGYEVRQGNLASGLHGITITYDEDGQRILDGGADPRREGTAEGH
jgi:gamma-glutamyltranspeptidase/glutathione hydrolase